MCHQYFLTSIIIIIIILKEDLALNCCLLILLSQGSSCLCLLSAGLAGARAIMLQLFLWVPGIRTHAFTPVFAGVVVWVGIGASSEGDRMFWNRRTTWGRVKMH